jgi:predicted membrane-bound spermidine synthase
MEHLARSLKVAWRSERLLIANEFRLTLQKVQLSALAGLVAILGLVMINLAVFFALVPQIGQPLAALCVGAGDLVLAIVLIVRAGSLKPAPEVEMIKEVRAMAFADIEEELSLAEAEVKALKSEVHAFVRNPVDTLLSGAVGPMVEAVFRGIASRKK